MSGDRVCVYHRGIGRCLRKDGVASDLFGCLDVEGNFQGLLGGKYVPFSLSRDTGSIATSSKFVVIFLAVNGLVLGVVGDGARHAETP